MKNRKEIHNHSPQVVEGKNNKNINIKKKMMQVYEQRMKM